MLFAPMSGEETRRNITDRANDLADQAKDVSGQVRDRVRAGVSAIRTGTERVTGTESSTPNL
jgi:gas vesicle protein